MNMKQRVLPSANHFDRRGKAGRHRFIEALSTMPFRNRDEQTAFANLYSFSGGCGGPASEIEKILSMHLFWLWSNL